MMADRLDIVVSTGDAVSKLKQMETAMRSLTTASAAFNSTGVSGFEGLSRALSKIRPINSSVATSITSLSTAVSKMSNASAVDQAASAMKRMTVAAQAMSKALGDTSRLTSAATAMNQLSAAARKMSTAFGSISKVSTAAQSIRNVATSAKTASAAFNNTSGLTNYAQGLQRLTNAAKNANSAMSGMGGVQAASSAVQRFGSAAARAGTQAQQFGAKVGQAGNSAGGASGKVRSLTDTLNAIRGSWQTQAITAFSAAVFNAGKSMQQFGLAMRTIAPIGDTMQSLTADIKSLANETATDVTAMAGNFQQFAIAGKQSGLSIKASTEIFKQFSVALRVLGKDTNSQKLSFLALTQMISKGKIQSEELRRQLAEQLPGAFELFAQAAGVSTAKLDDMMRNGQALAADILPKVAQILKTQYGPALAASMKTPVAQISLLRNHMTNFLDLVARGSGGEGGIFPGLAAALTNLNRVLDSGPVKAFAVAMGELIGLGFDVVAVGLNGIASAAELVGGVFEIAGNAFGAFLDMVSPVTDVIASAYNAVSQFLGSSSTLSGVMQVLGTSIGAVVSALAGIGLVLATVKISSWAVAASGATAIAAGAMTFLRNQIAGVAIAAGIATNGIRLMTLALAATGFGIAALGIGYIVTEVSKWVQKNRELKESYEPTVKSIADANPQLAKLGKEMRELGIATGMSASQTDDWAAALVRAHAGPEELAKAIEKEIKALEKKDQIEREAIRRMDEKRKKLVASGKTDEATQEGIRRAEKVIALLSEENDSTQTLLATKEAMLSVQNTLAETSDTAAQAVASMGQASDQATTAMQGTATVGQTLGTILSTAWAALTQGGTSADALAASLSKVQQQAQQPLAIVGVTDGQLKTSVEGVKQSVDGLATSVGNVGQSMTNVGTGAQQAATGLQTVGSALPTLGQSFAGIEQSTQSLSTNLREVGQGGAAGVARLSGSAQKGGQAMAMWATASDQAATSTNNLSSTASTTGSMLSSVMDSPIQRMGDYETAIDGAASALGRLDAARSRAGAGAGREGGVAGAMPQSTATRPSTFSGPIPHLADGVENTNKFSKRSAGGIPTILHPNEAVIPLSRGREVPVRIDSPMPQSVSVKESSSPDVSNNRRNTSSGEVHTQEITRNGLKQRPITVNFSVNAIDAGSFKQSEAQVLREFAVKLGRAMQQHG